MDAEAYLQKQGWIKGQPLQSGGIKHPLMVKHRKDTKGLGYNPLANEGWWERVFDGHLQSLNVTNGSQVQITQDEDVLRKATSILYTRFRSGGILTGTIDTKESDQLKPESKKRKRERDSKKKSKDNELKKEKHKRTKSNSQSKSKSDEKHKKEKREKKRAKKEAKAKSAQKSEHSIRI